ncbi:shikimate kinase [candidate division KSB1 bacterium]|nr:shikimate kinase [candidate division KSB1 bacterium]NIR69845.1 shikimate kinase [candidate division KSB1 bacterium]NIS24392.1 shikimate kinase [candidate division KSB1 bacterium]NIT71328.1 shikimate kinase [candidate division KSB1 bacterium]NIU27623.1 shikimate kinase [candidate division KSB1 bacterium]
MRDGKKDLTINDNIYLVGFMAAGKSTVGKLLAQQTGREYFDTDELVERRVGETIPEIFQKYGEEPFRDFEAEIIADIARKTRAVIALGGGAILRPQNRDRIMRSGVSIYLKWNLKTLLRRLQTQHNRPLADQKNGNFGETRIERLFESRSECYERADFVVNCVDGMSPEKVAEQILCKLETEK